ncbi:MAG TPA: 30S ribosomal protein S18 [Candidatus Acidoferrum sp.]|jgi:small subunit ribosomal protein S18|nr:30S ribosomal protein S18 [Candidatus Acidoferrum sp.]
MSEDPKQAQSHSGPPRREGGSGGHGPGGGHGGPRREGGPGGGPGGPGGPGGRPRGKRQYFRKKKVCKFCVEKMDFIDYKRADILSQFVQERGKILPRRMTGVCSRHQRWLGVAIKRARNIALLPFAGSAAGTQAPRQVVPQTHGAPAAHPAAAAPATVPAATPAVPPAAAAVPAAEAPKA